MTSSSIDKFHSREAAGNNLSSQSMGSLPTYQAPSNTHRSRIPTSLQDVFLASNSGIDVHKPPPDSTASKMFLRDWLFHERTNHKSTLSIGSLKKGCSKSRMNLLRSLSDHIPLSSLNRKKKKKSDRKKANDGDTISTGCDTTNNQSKFQKEQPHNDTETTCPRKIKIKIKPQVTLKPQQYLDSMIRSRGYSTIRYKTLESGYYYKPTELQQASYDPYIIRVVKKSECDELKQMLNCGMSPNPCNSFGESLLHTICRTGNSSLLQIMLDAGCDVAVSDDYGRTPLHDACWSAKLNIFDVIEQLLATDDGPSMFYLSDCRGSVPLEYVARDHWGPWIEWLEAHKNIYWPRRNLVVDGAQPPPPLTQLPPHSRVAPIPSHPLTLELAKMLVSGTMIPEEIEVLRSDIANDDDHDDDDSITDDDDNSLDSEFDSDSDDDSDEDDSLHADEADMKHLINFMNSRRSMTSSTDANSQLVQ